jgi:hypothetical protein
MTFPSYGAVALEFVERCSCVRDVQWREGPWRDPKLGPVCGVAHTDTGIIECVYPRSLGDLVGSVLHEVGHLAFGHGYDDKPLSQIEDEAKAFALVALVTLVRAGRVCPAAAADYLFGGLPCPK